VRRRVSPAHPRRRSRCGPVYIYENGTYDYIGDGLGRSLSTDATALAGNIFNTDGVQEAARWSDVGGWEGLGQLPNGLQCPSISSGYGISGDGSIVVGLGWDGCIGRAFKWTADAGMVELEALATGGNRATVISKDGQVAAGFGGIPARTPAYWNVADGSGHVINMEARGEFGAINDDGSVLAGRYIDDSMSGGYLLMCRWTEETGIEIIPSLPDYPGGYIHDMTRDGTLLVGSSGILIEGLAAIIWREDLGTVDLRELLLSYGVLAVQNVQLWGALAITEDGRTVVGYAYVPDEEFGLLRRAFVATLPEIPVQSCAEDLDGDGQVGFTDLTQLLGSWGPCI
jgi:uncharacterized membrane protein